MSASGRPLTGFARPGTNRPTSSSLWRKGRTEKHGVGISRHGFYGVTIWETWEQLTTEKSFKSLDEIYRITIKYFAKLLRLVVGREELPNDYVSVFGWGRGTAGIFFHCESTLAAYLFP